MTARCMMLQGTGSDVGKSVLVAAICRAARSRGYRVAPFKPQNMSNNAHACSSGGEIGRAQALQARAAGLEPHVDMNPVLLKPQSDQIAQVVVQGRAVDSHTAREYMTGRHQLLPRVLDSFHRLCAAYDLVIIEGAGSPAEINLRARDIANMGFARAAGVPVGLVGDIDRGGVIAALAGTRAVLDPADAAMIVGFLVNKFRGDISLFEDGVTLAEQHTGWPCWGVVPWLAAAARLPAEDAVVLEQPGARGEGGLKIAAPMLSRIANFDDLDALQHEPDVQVHFIPPGQVIPSDTDVIILLGTKSTRGDLEFLREQGWHHDIHAHVRRGGHVLGICGGYQMLGTHINDPHGYDGSPGTSEGLGLLQVSTDMLPEKVVKPAAGTCVNSQARVDGYEIHTGNSHGTDTGRPVFRLDHGEDGATSADGRVQGCYLHGLFNNNTYRTAWLQRMQPDARAERNYEAGVEQALDELAEGSCRHADLDTMLAAARAPGWQPGGEY